MSTLVADAAPLTTSFRGLGVDRTRFESSLATGRLTTRADLAPLAFFGVTHHSGLVMGA